MMIERYRGYDVVHCAVDGSYTVFRNGVRLGACWCRDLGKYVDTLEEMRTHEEPAAPTIKSKFKAWLDDMPVAKADRLFRMGYLGIFGVWMAFAVCLFIAPLVLP